MSCDLADLAKQMVIFHMVNFQFVFCKRLPEGVYIYICS